MRKTSLFAIGALLSVNFAFASDNSTEASQASPWNVSLFTILADLPEYDYQPGGDHFSGVTGPHDGQKATTTFNATYTIPTPLGEHWLLKGSKTELSGSIELTPITTNFIFETDFTLLPFIVLGAGTSLGTGWNMNGLDGFSKYEYETQKYKPITPFAHYYRSGWISGTFQFDLGAIVKGPWTHLVATATYQHIYAGITGFEDKRIYQWQETQNMANGWQYDFNGLIGYKMPLKLQMIAFMAELYGHYDAKDYGKLAESIDGDFMIAELSALTQFEVNKTNSITLMLTFLGDRSFATKHDNENEEPHLQVTGREWSFYRILIGWDHSF